MLGIKTKRISTSLLTGAAILAFLGWTELNRPVMAFTVTPGYSASLFAADPSGASQPDSVAISGNNVFIGYGNGTKSDGTDGLPTTIAEYTTSGQLVKTFSVPGHDDGLRVNPADGKVYALLNQDGNPLLTIIDTQTSLENTYTLPADPGRGYDDLQFVNGKIFASVSNPVDGTSTVLGQLIYNSVSNTYSVTSVLTAGAAAVDVNGNPVTLNVQDPDSLGLSPNGSLLLDDQDGQALITVSNPGAVNQKVTLLPHTGTSVDDTVIAPTGLSSLLVADTSGATEGIYQISGPFTPGTAYSAATNNNYVGTLDLTSGVITPVVSGLTSPHGLGFLSSVPEPNQALGGLITFGLFAAGLRLKRSKR